MFKNPYLLQIMKKPKYTEGDGGKPKPHHVFGGQNMGMSTEAWDVIDQLCTLHYMGASEFEFGIFPKAIVAMSELIKAQGVLSYSEQFLPAERNLNYKRKIYHRDKFVLTPARSACLYLFTPLANYGVTTDLEWSEDAHKYLVDLVRQKSTTKESTRIPEALDPLDSHDSEFGGWLDLENLCMAFSDYKMYADFCTKLFDTTPASKFAESPLPIYDSWKKEDLVREALDRGCFGTKTQAIRTKREDLISALNSKSCGRLTWLR